MADIQMLERDLKKYLKQLWTGMFIFLGVAGLAAMLTGGIGALFVIGAIIIGVVCVFIRIDILSAKTTAMMVVLNEEIKKSKG